MAVVWRMCLLVLLVQQTSGQAFEQEEIQQAVHRVQNILKVHNSRRLATREIPDFSKMCASACWKGVVEGMVTMYKKLESEPACAKMMGMDMECTGGEPPRRLDSSDANGASQCMFDQCEAGGNMAMMCASLKDPDSMFNKQLESSPDAKCSRISMTWFCDSICGADCKADNVEPRKIFCAPHEDTTPSADTGTTGTTGNTETTGQQAPQAEENCGGGAMDGDAMSDIYGFMCSQNDAGEYCQAKGMAWANQGAFQAQPEELFPDVCTINCDTPTGKAIKDLGCCMAGSMVGMSGQQQMAARAGVYACGGLAAMTFCGTSESLPIPQKMLVGGKGVDTCPTTTAEETIVLKSIASDIEVKTSTVSIITCKATGAACGGTRRLGEAKNTVEYTVRVKGTQGTIAAKQATIAAKMKTVETQTGAKVDVPAKGLQPQTNKAGQDPLSLSLGMLVIMGTIFW